MYNLLNNFQKEIWQKLHFKQPTAIQNSVFGPILNGENIVGISPTGTGKTLAYVLPLLQHVQPNKELQLLILAPSQELAQQIAQVIRDWSNGCSTQCITGGANLKRQIENLKKRPEVIVATPGRLLEISKQSKKVKYHTIKTVVIDEADYLLSDEHINVVREVVKKVPSLSQFICFSATMTPRLNDIEKWFGKQIKVIQKNQTGNLTHGYIVVDSRKRLALLNSLAKNNDIYAMVFVNNIINLMTLKDKLNYENVSVSMLHSDMYHTERQQELKKFKNKNTMYLLTTDVAMRGVDISNMPMVIQYDVPWEKDIYIHRAGRTARMAQKGLVITLVNDIQLKDYFKLLPNNQTAIEFILKNGKLQEK